ncbi:cilia- and flagella-associated protein 65 isoform X3 [Syngnathoides biaculeatus]|uniref:cilia- and flagella-associated protein 65 isoform X3 n=1 Tax=Syngnathoides biaculeatus TaxID=300417 RepID=UPI002ADD5ADB|nr:cilia- and flagella-associated protein 65 isoform X3 [Syngnathoides biaculeatus]
MCCPRDSVMLTESEDPKSTGSEALWNNFRHPGTQLKCLRRAPVQRNCFLGLETKPEVLWEDWDEGREYTKSLTLKNVGLKLQKLQLRPPVTKFFSISISRNISVSPGTTLSIPVTFRPAQRCKYEDSIEFQSKDGTFQIILRAVIPYPALGVPDTVLLPLCAVYQSASATFLLKNLSKLHTYFYWECSEPFQVSPEEGVLKPNQEIQLMVLFQPQQALLYNQHAFCSFGEEGQKVDCCATVLLQGAAKYPCLQLKNPSSKAEKQHGGPVLNFGSVAVGQSLQKGFDICNPSHVTAFFSLTRLPGGVPLFGSEFFCDVSSGKVAPGGSLSAKVTFAPTVAGSVSVEYLTVECKGALNKTVLKLTGNCAGPKLSFSSSLIDFGCIKVGATASHSIEMVNSSFVQATYQWDIDCAGHSVFSIQPQCGTLNPKSRLTLTIFYRPTMPVSHHRSVPCFILHGEPMFLDLLGTCHSDLQKPAVLKPEHLGDIKEARSDIISVLLPNNSSQLDPQAFCLSTDEKSSRQTDNVSIVRSVTPKEDTDQPASAEEDSPGLSSPPTRLSVVPSELLFHQVRSSSMSTSSATSQGVAITNNSAVKLTLVWTNAADSPFSVSPSTSDLSPLKSTSFRVAYNPKELNAVHAAQLECLAFKDQSQSCENEDICENEEPICPPWCVIVRVIGHSLEHGKELMYPNCSLEPNNVVFTGLSVRSHQTLLLRNNGEQPFTFFRNLNDSLDPALAVTVSLVPRCGLLFPGDHQILTVITTPKEDHPQEGIKLHLQLNSGTHTKEITVFSILEKISMSLGGGGSLYFQDTYVGSATKQTHFIRNVCRIPLSFQWNIRESDQELISVQPKDGELRVNEQQWSFNPREEKTYILEPTLTFWPTQDPSYQKSVLTLKVVGRGAKCFIQALKDVLDMGDTLVGRSQSVYVPLVNNSTCSISFIVSVEQTLQDEELRQDHVPATNGSICPALQLDCEGGTVASQSAFMLRATFRPDRQAHYGWTINYQTLNLTGMPLSPPKPVCEVRGNGVFPTLQVTDVSSGGVMAWLSKTYVWKLLSVDSLNAQLVCMPSPVEHSYRSPRRHSMRTYPTILIKAMVDINFSAAPLNSEPSTFALVFYNPGSIPVEWTFLFPDDQQVDFKHWSQGEELCNNELEQMQVGELFSVSPLSGTLLSGQQNSVQLSYSHTVSGTHQLPIILKILHGREILLHFQGVTVAQERPHLYFLSTHHVFTPIMIGSLTPPIQTYNLYNGGDVPVHYEVDAGVLSKLQENNFNQPLLCCLNPVGVALPGKMAKLEFIFSPLEAKMYRMDVPIHVRHGETTVVNFDGCGFGTQTAVFPSSDTKPVRCVRRIPVPEQDAFLSEDNIFLGDIPVCSQSSRVFFLTNVSLKEILYKWCLTQVIRIHPKQGLLRPGESIFCVLTFTATDYPTIYHLDIICQVTQHSALTQYSEALHRWEQERVQQQNEFTITERDLAESQKVLTDKVPTAVIQTKGPSLGKYKTLPPICSRLARAQQRAESEAVKVSKRPTPPNPMLLHLEVSARSYHAQEYLRYFPNRFNNRFRCFHSIKHLRPQIWSDALLQEGRPSQILGPERHFLQHVITSLIKSILDDDAFTRSLLQLASKPLFYKPKVIFSPPSPLPQPLIGLDETNPELHVRADSLGTAAGSGTRLKMPPRAERIPMQEVPPCQIQKGRQGDNPEQSNTVGFRDLPINRTSRRYVLKHIAISYELFFIQMGLAMSLNVLHTAILLSMYARRDKVSNGSFPEVVTSKLV